MTYRRSDANRKKILNKRARLRLERYIETLIDVAGRGNAPPADWVATDIEYIVGRGLLKGVS